MLSQQINWEKKKTAKWPLSPCGALQASLLAEVKPPLQKLGKKLILLPSICGGLRRYQVRLTGEEAKNIGT